MVVRVQALAALSSVKSAGIAGCLGPHGLTLFLPRGAHDPLGPLKTLLGICGLPVVQ